MSSKRLGKLQDWWWSNQTNFKRFVFPPSLLIDSLPKGQTCSFVRIPKARISVTSSKKSFFKYRIILCPIHFLPQGLLFVIYDSCFFGSRAFSIIGTFVHFQYLEKYQTKYRNFPIYPKRNTLMVIKGVDVPIILLCIIIFLINSM